MDTFPYMFAGYAAIWLIFFGFVFHLQRRQKALQEDLALLQQKLAEAQKERPS